MTGEAKVSTVSIWALCDFLQWLLSWVHLSIHVYNKVIKDCDMPLTTWSLTLYADGRMLLRPGRMTSYYSASPWEWWVDVRLTPWRPPANKAADECVPSLVCGEIYSSWWVATKKSHWLTMFIYQDYRGPRIYLKFNF